MSELWLFVSDVDDTLLGDNVALAELMLVLQNAGNVVTAYNSSRPCASLRKSLAAVPQLALPDYLIGGLGTEIEDGRSGQPLAGYTEFLGDRWHRADVMAIAAELRLVPHDDEFQTPLKASFDVPGAETMAQVRRLLAENNLAAKLIFSGDKNLDIIPAHAGKGGVIKYLSRRLGIPSQRVLVAGDSGNDIEMFEAPHRGIIVGNADADLRQLKGAHIYKAQRHYAAGILEGLRYWGVV